MGNVCGQYEKHYSLSRQCLFHAAFSPWAFVLNENVGFACGGFIALPASDSQQRESNTCC
jgi:hypothetical protein